MKDPMIVGVLANDNPQGLLLACRLLRHARIRVSVGGRLGRLLEEGWTLTCEDPAGKLVNVKTKVMKRGEENSTKAEEDASGLDTLWLCDWKDPATGWYSLADCNLILQTSKATDSKTVAMWLVEVCKEDAVIISLQAGLHNARELRSVFGHEGGAVTAEQDMPLVASHNGRRATGSVDTTDGVQSRRESASSIYSEFSGMEDDSSVDPLDRSASPLPPGFSAGLASPSSSDSHDSFNRERRKSFVGVETEDKEEEESKLSDTKKDSMSRINKHRSAPASTTTTTTAAVSEEAASTASVAPALPSNIKKPQTILLAGLLGFGACCMCDETTKIVKCMLTHHGAIVMERLTKHNSLLALGRLLLLERSKFKIRYRAKEETNNWLWGDVVWRTFEAYGAALRLDNPGESRSLYALLSEKDPIHRRVYAGLLDEALSALRWQKVELMDPVSSPFGLSFRAARSLLLLPQPVFEFCLWLVLRLRFPTEYTVAKTSPYCDATMVHRYMAPFLNGEVVRIGFEGEVSTPLNQEILESLSVAARNNGNSNGTGQSAQPLVKTTPLPELFTMTFFVTCISCLVLLFAVFARFIWFVIEVTFFW
jgi:hypothetical protein